MAIDTREERQTSIAILMPFQSRGVDPDIGIDQGERQTAAFSYSGITAEAPTAGGGTEGLQDMDSLINLRRVLR